MTLASLLYISEARIWPDKAEAELDNILATAHATNPTIGITGALLFTGTHFAQLLEGDEALIERLMVSITRDPRHDRVRVVTRGPLTERSFPDWSMAYKGPSQFVSRHVTRLLGDPMPPESQRSAQWLAELLIEVSGKAASRD